MLCCKDVAQKGAQNYKKNENSFEGSVCTNILYHKYTMIIGSFLFQVLLTANIEKMRTLKLITMEKSHVKGEYA